MLSSAVLSGQNLCFFGTRTPPLPSVAPDASYVASRLHKFRGLGRQLARYRASSIVLTALSGAHGTQRAVDWGSVLIRQRATRCLLSASLRLPTVAGDRRDDAEGGHSGSGDGGVVRLKIGASSAHATPPPRRHPMFPHHGLLNKCRA